MKTVEKNLKYKFTEAELREKATRLAEVCRKHEETEDEKKQVMSDFKARLDGHSAEISRLSNHINNGYEYRNIKCEVLLDVPHPGSKSTMRLDTNEIVTVESMTADDKQLELAMEDGNAG